MVDLLFATLPHQQRTSSYSFQFCQMRISVSSMFLAVVVTGCTASHHTMPRAGQHPQTFERRISVRGNFLLFLPEGAETQEKKWPLIIFLHGSGESGQDLKKVKVNGIPHFVEQQPDFPFIVVSPQSPTGFGWSPPVLNALLDEVIESLPVDTDRV